MLRKGPEYHSWWKIEAVPEPSKEGLKKVGVAVVIVNELTRQVWVIQENVQKEETGRQGGEFSLPLETRKVNESVPDNVLGALREFRHLLPGEELVWMHGISLHPRRELKKAVEAETVILVLRHAQTCTQEQNAVVDSHEVTPQGWWHPVELLAQSSLRSGVENFLAPVVQEKLIERVLDAVVDETQPRSILNYQSKELQYPLVREKAKDWTGITR